MENAVYRYAVKRVALEPKSPHKKTMMYGMISVLKNTGEKPPKRSLSHFLEIFFPMKYVQKDASRVASEPNTTS